MRAINPTWFIFISIFYILPHYDDVSQPKKTLYRQLTVIIYVLCSMCYKYIMLIIVNNTVCIRYKAAKLMY